MTKPIISTLLNGNILIITNNKNYEISENHPKFLQLTDLVRGGEETSKDLTDLVNDIEKWFSEKTLVYTITNQVITLKEDNEEEFTLINRFDRRFKVIKECLEKSEFNKVRELLTPEKAIESLDFKGFKMSDGVLYFNDQVVPDSISKRVKLMVKKGMDLAPILKFWEKLSKNPSFNSRNQLFNFLEKNNIPIEADGNFIAYKKVTFDYKDIHTKTIDNSINQVIKLDRSQVDDNPNNTCSSGLHICSFEYLTHFHSNTPNDRVVLCSVNPEHMVSVPTDYQNTKARVCEYKVIGELENVQPLNQIIFNQEEDFSDPTLPLDHDEVEEELDQEQDQSFQNHFGYSEDLKDTVVNYVNQYSDRYQGKGLVARILEEIENDNQFDDENIDEELIEQILVDNGHYSN